MFANFSTLDSLLFILLGIMIVVSVRNMVYLVWNIRYFNKPRSYNNRGAHTRFFIVVPLMDEVTTIPDLVEAMQRLRYPRDKVCLVLATTSRERDSKGRNPTHDAALAYIRALPPSKSNIDTQVHMSTKQTGYVATQINHAIAKLGKQITPHDFIVMYNADSAPHPDTLLAVNEIIINRGERVNVLQQSSLFTKNFQAMLRAKQFSAAANALHQTLWTLKHEVSMTRRQSALSQVSSQHTRLLSRFLRTRFTVCVGHGMFIRKRYYDRHPLNEDASIEDTQYGLYQSLQQTPVYTVPVLENSESPSTYARVLAQKRGWFKLVFDLAKLLKQHGRKTFKSKRKRAEFISITTQVIALYSVWFTHSLFITGTLVLAIVLQQWVLLALWGGFYALYWLIPAALLSYFHARLIPGQKLTPYAAATSGLLGFASIASHSLGPWLAIFDTLTGSTTRKKTQR